MTTQWQTILSDLKAKGLTQADIERRTFMSTAALTKLEEGAEPKHFKGDGLVKLWREVTGSTEPASLAPAPKKKGGRPRKASA